MERFSKRQLVEYFIKKDKCIICYKQGAVAMCRRHPDCPLLNKTAYLSGCRKTFNALIKKYNKINKWKNLK